MTEHTSERLVQRHRGEKQPLPQLLHFRVDPRRPELNLVAVFPRPPRLGDQRRKPQLLLGDRALQFRLP
ncbi:MAG: hypothetical protein ABI112_10665 [Terracoccus sp.]